VKYIRENRAKHDLPAATNKLNRLLEEMTSHPANTRKAGDTTGFDVVIGNPPYVDIKNLEKNYVDYLFANFKTTQNRINLYSIFIEIQRSL
jgi:methylase of polypeptide subunit release factors